MSPRSFADVKSISTIVVAVLALSVFCGKVVAQAGCDKQTAICVTTQGDSATPIAIPNPVIKQNKVASKIDIGPLSPIESCSLTSVTSTPSTTTDQASLARLIGILLGTTIAAPTVPAGPQVNLFQQQINPQILTIGGTCDPSPGAQRLEAAEDNLKKVDLESWIERRKAAQDALNVGQRLLLIGARQRLDPADTTVGQFLRDCQQTEGMECNTFRIQLQFLADCLNEEAKACVSGGTNYDAIPAGDKLEYERNLAEAVSNLTAAASLLKPPVAPTCDENQKDPQKKKDCKAEKANYDCYSKEYPRDLNELYTDQATAAGLQNDDTKLRAGEAALATIYAQVFKVSQHINASTMRDGPSGLYESLALTPGKDSDLAASVTCTSLVDNTTTLGPVPVTIHAGVPHLVFSAGGVISLTPTQTLGVVPVHDNSTATFHNVIAQTGHNNFQVIPFAFETFRFMPWRARQWDTAGFRGFGITGGIGYNAYSGVNGIDFFAGGSVRVMDKVYVHIGSHFGRYTRLDPHSSYDIGQTVPSSGFPSTVPTVTHFTGHLAFGASYSF